MVHQWWSPVASAACLLLLVYISLQPSQAALKSRLSSISRGSRLGMIGLRSRGKGCLVGLRIRAAKRPFDDDEGSAEVWRLIQRDREDFKKLMEDDVEELQERPDFEIADSIDEKERQRQMLSSSFRSAEGEIGAPVSAASIKADSQASRKSPFEMEGSPSPVSPFEGFADDKPVSPFSSQSTVSPFADTAPKSPFADSGSAPTSPFAEKNPFQEMEDKARKARAVDPGFPTAAQPAPGAPQPSELAKAAQPWYKSASIPLILSFATISGAMLATVSVVFKMGGIHYNDF